MKFDLLKMNSIARKSITGKWWTCKVVCDSCGKEIYKGALWATMPNVQERDLCDNCRKEK